MKKIILITLSISSLFFNCRQPIIIPVVGAVEGKIVNIHNEPINGAEVTITHIPASESSEAEERTISTTTDFEGKFILEDVWDEFRIDVEKSGFRLSKTVVTADQDFIRSSWKTFLVCMFPDTLN